MRRLAAQARGYVNGSIRLPLGIFALVAVDTAQADRVVWIGDWGSLKAATLILGIDQKFDVLGDLREPAGFYVKNEFADLGSGRQQRRAAQQLRVGVKRR